MRRDEELRDRRWDIYWLIGLTAIAITVGRIAVFHGRDGETAFGSANDRSRWATVASLVEHGTYAIDTQIALRSETYQNRRPWDTIDKVRHLGRDGKQHFYSSKPPLFPTLVAGVYVVVNVLTGMTLTEQPLYATRLVLILVNVPLLSLFYFATISSIDILCRSEWAKIVVAIATCFGTLLLPFSISLNNHLPAAAATAAVMWIFVMASEHLDNTVVRVVAPFPIYWWVLAGLAAKTGIDFSAMLDGYFGFHIPDGPDGVDVVLAGLAAAFAVANELPSLSMFVLWVILFAFVDRLSILPFLAGAVVVAIAFFGTNWIAHQSWRPPYAHRGNGAYIAELPSEVRPPDDELIEEVRMALLKNSLTGYESEISITPSEEPDRWIVQADENRYALIVRENKWKLNEWDDWYEYPGTYWKEGVRKGVDKGEPSRWVYLFQMTLGHHGIFSLTPIWLLVPWGLVGGLRYGPADYRRLNAAVLIASVVCIAFYVALPLVDRNYGGVSIGFRWMLWLAPLWLLMLAPVVEELSDVRWGRRAIYALLAISIFSVSTCLETPWDHPWLYRYWAFLGWIEA